MLNELLVTAFKSCKKQAYMKLRNAYLFWITLELLILEMVITILNWFKIIMHSLTFYKLVFYSTFNAVTNSSFSIDYVK